MKKISFDCPHCAHFQTLTLNDTRDALDFACGHCTKPLGFSGLNQDVLSRCPVCGNDKLHQHKDFNKKLGIGIFVLGAVLGPWTYFISLIIALLVDAALYPFFPWMQVCYFCKSELRGFGHNPALDRFSHETAAHYEYSKTKWLKHEQ